MDSVAFPLLRNVPIFKLSSHGHLIDPGLSTSLKLGESNLFLGVLKLGTMQSVSQYFSSGEYVIWSSDGHFYLVRAVEGNKVCKKSSR
jgi:hypothetical protein